MAYADFSHVQLTTQWSITIKNVNMKGAIFSDDLLLNEARNNVILPNGTWSILNENLIRNGDAETVNFILVKTNIFFDNFLLFIVFSAQIQRSMVGVVVIC